MIRALACVHDLELVHRLMEQLCENQRVNLTTLSDLPDSTAIFHALHIDVLVLDCTRHTKDALIFGSQIAGDPHHSMRIIYMFQRLNEEIVQYVTSRHQDAVLLCAPFTVEELVLEIMKTGEDRKTSHHIRHDAGGAASQVIQNMGIPVHLNGFRYVKTAVILFHHCDHGDMPMKQLYKEIARIHVTTASRVEKAIRDAIEYASRVSFDRIQMDGRKPTNSQLVHLVYERMLSQDAPKVNYKKEEVDA